ncbi:MAG: phage major capsid protein [Planctomycetota bacterium]
MSLYNKAKKLREERKQLHQDQTQLHKAATDESRDLTTEEQGKWDEMSTGIDTLTTQIEDVESQIERHEERSQTLQGRHNDWRDRPSQRPDEQDVDDSPEARDEQRRRDDDAPEDNRRAAFTHFLRAGVSSMTPEQRSALQFNAPADATLPQVEGGPMVTVGVHGRAQSAETDATGGYTVAEAFGNRIVESMKAFGGMREFATEVTTTTGAKMPFPTSNQTAQIGRIIAENTEITDKTLNMGVRELDAYMYTSDIVKVSLQLLQDSAFDIESWLGDKLGEFIGRITNQHFTTGTGTNQPNGIMTAGPVGHTAAATSALAADELLDLKHSVDPAYRRRGGRWMFNDTTLKALKKLTVGATDARPLWQPGIRVGEPNTIDGDPYLINQDVASIGASARSVGYGLMSEYYIRDVRDVTVLRLAERYAEFLQVGFLAFSRHDGELMDTAAFKVLAHPAS